MSLNAADLPARLTMSGVTDSAGVCTVEIRSAGQVAWEVSQITIDMPTAPSGCAASLRINDALVSPMIAAGDAAGGDPPLSVYPGDTVTVEWIGATPGDQGRVLVIYRTARYLR